MNGGMSQRESAPLSWSIYRGKEIYSSLCWNKIKRKDERIIEKSFNNLIAVFKHSVRPSFLICCVEYSITIGHHYSIHKRDYTLEICMKKQLGKFHYIHII